MTFLTIDGGRGLLPQLSVEVDVTNVPTGSTRTWTDLTPDVRSLTYTVGGRSDELQRTQPGALTLTLSNKTGKYDPTYGSGVGLKRAQWLRVQAKWSGVTYPLWQGIIEAINQSWLEAGRDAVTTVTAADASKVAQFFDLAGSTYPAETSDTRASAVCAQAGLAFSADDGGASTLVAVSTAFPTGTFASAHLQDIEATENGLLFADAAGQIRFQSRHYRQLHATTPVDTLDDEVGAAVFYRNAEFDDDDAYIYNNAIVTPTNADGSTGTPQTASNTSSSSTFYWDRWVNRTILSSDANEALSCAQFLVARYGDPSPRVPVVEVLGQRNTAKWPTILALENSQRLTFKRRASAHTITEDMYVEQVGATIVPDASWVVRLQMSPASDTAVWILGDSTYGVLDSTTVLSY